MFHLDKFKRCTHSPILGLQCHSMLIPHVASQPFPRLVILPPCSKQLAEKGMLPKQVRVWPSIPRREGLKQEESKQKERAKREGSKDAPGRQAREGAQQSP